MSEEKSNELFNRKDFPPNSYRSKSENPEPKNEETEERRVEKVVTGEVIKKKRTIGGRIIETFTGEDARSVGSYILFDVAIPAFKNFITDATTQGIERLLFGSSNRPSRSSRPGGGSGYTSYNKVYGNSREEPYDRTISRRARNTHDFEEIILETRAEAEEVLDQLTFLVRDYDVARVSDLYDLVGITGNFTDNKWGWTNLSMSRVRRARNGYLIELPRPEPLN